MSRELALNTKELDEEFKIRLTEIQPYVTALKWTNYGIYKVCFIFYLV